MENHNYTFVRSESGEEYRRLREYLGFKNETGARDGVFIAKLRDGEQQSASGIDWLKENPNGLDSDNTHRYSEWLALAIPVDEYLLQLEPMFEL